MFEPQLLEVLINLLLKQTNVMKFDKRIADFLSTEPLYKKLETKVEIMSPYDFDDFGVKFYCSLEQSDQTHKLELYPSSSKAHYGSFRGDSPPEVLLNSETNQLHFIQHYKGICQSCKSHSLDVLIEVSTKESFYESGRMFTIRKLGQYPAHSIKPDNEFNNYLGEEDIEYYKKALMNLSHSYGIGAYAYLRKIVENEIIKLIKSVAELNFEHSQKLKALIEQHEKKHNIATLIDKSYEYLPESLKSLGVNPFKLLYGELSIGIHKLTDEDCLERATSLNDILKFVIKRIYEEKTEIVNIKKAIRKLNE
jgi:hypothetical protein